MNAETSIVKQVDQIGAFPAEYDTDALPERRYAALARMMTIVAVVEGFAIAAMSFAFAALMPLQKVVPMVVTSNSKGDEIIRVNPATLSSPTADYVTEISLRDYVNKRYSVVGNSAEQLANMGPDSTVQLMSTPDAYQTFLRQSKDDYERLRGSHMTRSVRIDSVRKIGESTWQVEYHTTEQADQTVEAPTSPGTSEGWISTFTVKFEPKNVHYSDRLNNPFGMTIVTASDSRRD